MNWVTRTDEDGAVWCSFDKEQWFRVYTWDKRPTGVLASNAKSSPPRSESKEKSRTQRYKEGRLTRNGEGL